MRTLKRNKTELWYVVPSGVVDEVDSDGNYTGEKITTYGSPVKFEINIYPYVGDIVEKTFGVDDSIDMIAVSNEISLSPKALIFKEEPTGDYFTTYDFSISKILASINTRLYGFKGRV